MITIEELLENEEAARLAYEADRTPANAGAYSKARAATNKFLGRD